MQELALHALTCVVLKERCRQSGLKVGDNKTDLVACLQRAADLLNACDRPKAQWRWGANGTASYVHCSLCDAKVLTIDQMTCKVNWTFCNSD
eukprot:9378270-Heterocapsa_arctica.AAC.1